MSLGLRSGQADPHGLWSSPKLNHFPILPNQRHLRHSDKQAVLDHSGHASQFFCQRRRVGDFAEDAVQDVMAFIGDVGVAVRVAPQRNLRA